MKLLDRMFHLCLCVGHKMKYNYGYLECNMKVINMAKMVPK